MVNEIRTIRQLNGYNFEGREKLVRKKETKN